MKVTSTSIPDVKIIEPTVYEDERGYFFESYNQKELAAVVGIEDSFVQDNHSYSVKHVLRGLHYQLRHQQDKLVRVIAGEVYDVVVDLRKISPTFGQWVGIRLSSEKHQLVWIPKGFAHGFLTISDQVHFLYKTTDYYDRTSEECIRWNDPDLSIQWPIEGHPLQSTKDQQGKFFKDALVFT
jgi:dTDP-4-dehydrorhamnose 3,5-epimerase